MERIRTSNKIATLALVIAAFCAACWVSAAGTAYADELQPGQVASEGGSQGTLADVADGLQLGMAAKAEELVGALATQAGNDVYQVGVRVHYGQTEARAMWGMINDFRQSEDTWVWNEDNSEQVYFSGLPALEYDFELERVAMLRAAELALNFDRQRPNGRYATSLVGITIGEAYGAGFPTAAAMFESWKEADSGYDGQLDRRNMLRGLFTAVGIGHVVANGTHYWAMELGVAPLDSTSTVVDDTERTVDIDVRPSMVTSKKVNAPNVTLHRGETLPLPEIAADVAMKETYPGPTAPVTMKAQSWTSGNDAIVSIENGNLVGHEFGTTTIKGELATGETVSVAVTVQPYKMYRLYNPHSGEHFYTASGSERDSVQAAGWTYEGVGWTAPEPDESQAPVFRLYNPHAGDHHYTMDAGERDSLVKVGWLDEGVGWYSDSAEAVPLYRQYNPNAVTGTHNYTTDKAENDMLVEAGWLEEGIGWYGVA